MTDGPDARVRRIALAATVVHPVPSLINAVLVATLALVAGGDGPTAALLAIAMVGFQFSIGALNDLVDAPVDASRSRPKPIPAGLVAVPAAGAIVVIGAAVGLAISATFGIMVLLLGALGYGTGVAYDVVMRRLDLGWLCYAAAFPLLLAWAWLAAAATLPPAWPLLLAVAALAGPALHLANSLVDADSDRASGRGSLAVRLGPERARLVLVALMATILALAWATLLSIASAEAVVVFVALGATVAVALGVALSIRGNAIGRETGWLAQAGGLAAMAAAWLAAMAVA